MNGKLNTYHELLGELKEKVVQVSETLGLSIEEVMRELEEALYEDAIY